MEAVGEELYSVIVQVQPELAGKLVGMLLQLGEEECWACLEDQERLAEALDKAMQILAQAGGETSTAPAPKASASRSPGDDEKRIDSEDGQARTLSELRELCAGKYTEAEILQYWQSLRPADPSKAPAGKGAPAGKAAARPKASGYPAAEAPTPAAAATPSRAAPAAPAAPAPATAPAVAEEALPGLTVWLTELKLSKYLAVASEWIDEQGACSLEEVMENLEDFAEGLNLKTLERQRLERGAEKALEVANSAPPPAIAAPAPEPELAPAPAASKSSAPRPSVKSKAKSKAASRPTAEEIRLQREAEQLEADKRREAEELAAETARLAEEAERLQQEAMDEMAELQADAEAESRAEEARAAPARMSQPRSAPSKAGPAVRVAPKARTISQEEAAWIRENERQEKEFKRQEQIRQAKMEAEAAEKAAEEKRLAKAREAEERASRAAAELAAKMAAASPKGGATDGAAEEFPALGASDWQAASVKKGKKKR